MTILLESKPVESKREPWQLYAVFLGALSAVLGAVAASRDLLPSLLFSILITATSLSIVLAVGYGIIGQRIVSSAKRTMEAQRKDQLSKECLREFKDFVQEYWRISYAILGNAMQNLPSNSITEFPKSMSEKHQAMYLQPLHDLNNDLANLPSQNVGLWDLIQAVRRLETSITVYLSVYVWSFIQVATKLKADGLELPAGPKKLYETFREEFNDFVRRYNAFGKKWNRDIFENIFNTYIQTVDPLP